VTRTSILSEDDPRTAQFIRARPITPSLEPDLHLDTDIVDHCCDAWNKLIDRPWLIMSLGLREWAHGF
jgi:hypothetical protein